MNIQEIRALAGRVETVTARKIDTDEPFVDFAARFAHMPGTVILLSGGDLDCARYHILAARPWCRLTGRKRNMLLSINDQEHHVDADPFEALQILLQSFSVDIKTHLPDLQVPVACGLFGYLSYDLKDHLEKLPNTSIDDLCLPHICLYAPSIVVVHDKKDHATYLCLTQHTHSKRDDLDQAYEDFKRIVTSKSTRVQGNSVISSRFRSNFEKNDYIHSIEKIKEYIASGDVYQVNLSQRFGSDFTGDPYNLFQTLYQQNPAPFFAYIHAGSHHIVSTSPERFILKTGDHIETRPIKGTRPRGTSPVEDKRLRQELLESEKDDAELSMIVDLLRNDLGKVCTAGTVRVAEHKRIESYRNVYHLVSVIEGRLREGCDAVDLIRATFPGGSITGCPKIRSMEIIDELELNRRHIYTGSIGYISFHNTMDLSIAIRTATVLNNRLIFSTGGAIVIDSNPDEEYEETLHKGQTLMDTFQKCAASHCSQNMAWINGVIKPLDQAHVPITDQGLQ
jgi:para-aminobenzoate synthetase component I